MTLPPPEPVVFSDFETLSQADLEQRIQEDVRSIKEHEEEIVEKTSRTARPMRNRLSREEIERERTLHKQVYEIAQAFSKPGFANSFRALNQSTRTFLSEIPKHSLTQNNSLIIARIVAAGTETRGDNVSDLRVIRDILYETSYMDPSFTREIFRKMHTQLSENGLWNERINDFVIDRENIDRRNQSIQRKAQQIREFFIKILPDSSINEIEFRRSVEDRIRQQIELEYQHLPDNQRPSREEIDRRVNASIDQELFNLRGELRIDALGYTSVANTPEQRRNYFERLNNRLATLYRDGVITRHTYELFSEHARQWEEISNEIMERQVVLSKDELMRYAEHYNFNDRQREVLYAITSLERFKELMRRPEYRHNGRIHWEKLRTDIKDIIETCLSVADERPEKAFSEAFSPIHDLPFIKMLHARLQRLSDEIEDDMSADSLRDEIVEIRKPVSMTRDRITQSSEGTAVIQPQIEYSKISVQRKRFAEAVNSELAGIVFHLMNVTEVLHNVLMVCAHGSKFEDLANYLEQLDVASVDELLYDDELMAKAYQYYVSGISEEITSNNGYLRQSFGRVVEDGLDAVELQARSQLMAEFHDGESQEVLKRKLRHKVRMASAISKGITGEFWGLLVTGRWPNQFEKVPRFDSHGRVKIDPRTGKQEYVYRPKITGHGTSMTAYEKMAQNLDLDLLLERFGLPSIFPMIRWVYGPIEIVHTDNMPGAYDIFNKYDGWAQFNHENIYELVGMHTTALAEGRDNRTERFDQHFMILVDWLKTKGVDLLVRGGWRLENVYAHLVTDQSGNVIFDQTIRNLMRVGTIAVNHFLSSMIDDTTYQNVSDDLWEEITGMTRDKRKRKFNLEALPIEERGRLRDIDIQMNNKVYEEQKTQFISKARHRYVFRRYERYMPSVYFHFERPRITPRGEYFLKAQMMETLKTYFPQIAAAGREGNLVIQNTLFPLFVSALSFAEKRTWHLIKDNEAADYEYEFGVEHIEAMREELMRYFSLKKASFIGEESDLGYQIMQYLTPERFVDLLKMFMFDYRTLLSMPRWDTYEKTQANKAYCDEYIELRNLQRKQLSGQTLTVQESQRMDEIQNHITRTNRFVALFNELHGLRERREKLEKLRNKAKKLGEWRHGVFFVEEEEEELKNLKRKIAQKEREINDLARSENVTDEELKMYEQRSGQITLSKRYMGRYDSSINKMGLEYAVGLFDLDMSRFLWRDMGKRGMVRMFGETNGLASKMNSALSQIMGNTVEFCKRKYKNPEDMEKAMEELFVKPLREIHAAIANMDRTQANEYVARLVLLLSKSMAEDRKYRVAVIGDLLSLIDRFVGGKQPTLLADDYPITRNTHLTTLDSNGEYHFIHYLLNRLDIKPTADQIDRTQGYRTRYLIDRKIFGRHIKWFPYGSRMVLTRHTAPSIESVVRAAGVSHKVVFFEQAIPYIVIVLILISLAMAYAASKKNKKN